MKTPLLATLSAVLVLGSSSQAQQGLSIVNPGFEADVIAAGTFQVPIPQGWSVYDPTSIINQSNNAVGLIRPTAGLQTYFPGGTTEGNNAALVFLAGAEPGEAGLQQTLSSTLVANTRYTLTVDIGNIASGTSVAGSAGGGGVFYDLDGFPGYRLDLLAAGAVIGSDNNSLAGSVPEGEFRTASFNVDIGAAHPQLGQALSIRLVNLHAPETVPGVPNIEVDFDNVQLTATVIPEPSTLTLLALGAGCGLLRRKTRQSSGRRGY